MSVYSIKRLKWIAAFMLLAVAACSSTPAAPAQNLPTGDASRGAELFTQSIGGAPACSSCHTLNGNVLVGPSFQGYVDVAGTRVESTSAEDYTHMSIIQPAAYIVSGFGNSMYTQYGQRLSPQEIADLVAYLLTL
jgi:mono/diheme cytochrome c family protein